MVQETSTLVFLTDDMQSNNKEDRGKTEKKEKDTRTAETSSLGPFRVGVTSHISKDTCHTRVLAHMIIILPQKIKKKFGSVILFKRNKDMCVCPPK